MDLVKNTQKILTQVAEASCGREHEQVDIIAVTKYVDIVSAQALVDLGINHLGENRVDKFLDKYHQVKGENLTWHLIGSLQRRKVKDVIDYVDYFHALDSVNLAKEIQKRATKPVNCFLQVNISKEDSKHGFYLEDIDQVIASLQGMDKIVLVGLMTMTPAHSSLEERQTIFRQAKQEQVRLANKQLKNMPFHHLSMGMSGDFVLAIQEGATFVRVGQSFFKE